MERIKKVRHSFVDFAKEHEVDSNEDLVHIDPDNHLLVTKGRYSPYLLASQRHTIINRKYYDVNPDTESFVLTDKFGRNLMSSSGKHTSDLRLWAYAFERSGEGEPERGFYYEQLRIGRHISQQDYLSVSFTSEKHNGSLTASIHNRILEHVTFSHDVLIPYNEIEKVRDDARGAAKVQQTIINQKPPGTFKDIHIQREGNQLYVQLVYDNILETAHIPFYLDEMEILGKLAGPDLLLDPTNPDINIDTSWRTKSLQKAVGINYEVRDLRKEEEMKQMLVAIRRGDPPPDTQDKLYRPILNWLGPGNM